MNETKRPLDVDSEAEVTQPHYDLLAKAVTFGETGCYDEWEEQFFDESTKHISATRDAFHAFLNNDWSEKSEPEQFEIDGHSCVYWEKVQVMKGQPRVSVTIVDFGGLRMIYQV